MTKNEKKFFCGALVCLVYLGYKNHKRITNLQRTYNSNAEKINKDFEFIFRTLNTLNCETNSDAPLFRWKGDIATWREDKEV